MKRYEHMIATTARRFGIEISRASSNHDRLPPDITLEDRQIIEFVRPYTMTSSQRLWALIQAVRYVIDNGIPGDFVECGVWRGGSVMAMAQTASSAGDAHRRIWLYDTFSGMTAPTEHDIEAETGTRARDMLASTPVGDGANVWCVASQQDVERNLRLTQFPIDRFTVVAGDVAQTLIASVPQKISLLRLDTDWYASTRISLEVLYPRLTPGGVCILDDYGHWEGARKAVDEYFSTLPSRPLLMPIDYSGRILIKPQRHELVTGE